MEKTSRLYEQAQAAHRSGRSIAAIDLLERALAQAPSTVLRARIQHLRGMIGIWGRAPMRVHELLRTEAVAVERLDPRLAGSMLATAAQAALMAGEPEIAAETSARGLSITGGQSSRATRQAIDLVLMRPAEGREEAIQRGLAELSERDEEDSLEALQHGAAVLYWLEDYSNAGRVLQYVIDRARARRHPVLPVALDTFAALAFRSGRWSVADARSSEALRLARELEQDWVIASCLTTLARVAAVRGHEQQSRAYLSEARQIAVGGDLTSAYAASAAALLELGLGRAEDAIAELEPLLQRASEQVVWSPMIVPWTPDLIEAYARAGRSEEAAEVLEGFQKQAVESQRVWALAGAARCQGLLAPAAEFEHHFSEALRYHSLTRAPFELARTELCFGERLRRSRRHTEATNMLRSALGTFERLSATPWAERARRELAHKRTRNSNTKTITELLTPHELQVASLIERGATNRQAADTLFVSPKTIDYHLTNIYTKLDIHTRTELAYRLSRETTITN